MIASEHRELFGKSARLVSAISTFGDKPLLVIAAGRPNPAFGDVAEEYQRYWIEQSRALSLKSASGRKNWSVLSTVRWTQLLNTDISGYHLRKLESRSIFISRMTGRAFRTKSVKTFLSPS